MFCFMPEDEEDNPVEEAAISEESDPNEKLDPIMKQFMKDLNLDFFIEHQYKGLESDLQKFRFDFKYKEVQQNDEITETDEGKLVVKTYFDAKLLIKNKALQDRDYELFEQCHSMTDEVAMKKLMHLFRNDEQFRLQLK